MDDQLNSTNDHLPHGDLTAAWVGDEVLGGARPISGWNYMVWVECK